MSRQIAIQREQIAMMRAFGYRPGELVLHYFVKSTSSLNGMGDEFRVDARIAVWETPLATKVPAGAMFRKGKDWVVFVVKNKRARTQPISVGQSNNLEAEILSGLSPEDDVVNYPSDKIRDGIAVSSE